MGTTKLMKSSKLTTMTLISFFSEASSFVLYVLCLFFDTALGPPVSASPFSAASMRLTDELIASLNFSSCVSTGMFSEMMPSMIGSPTFFMNDGPPTIAPSLPVLTSRSTPCLSPSCTVGYHFSITLSANSNGSAVNTSLRSVTTSMWYPVSICSCVSSLTTPATFARLSTFASSYTYLLFAGCCARMSSSVAMDGAGAPSVAAIPSDSPASPLATDCASFEVPSEAELFKEA
mmetsp:Transcript_3733/g.8397  ORF Transcript_3733/g.8397 Transcript_3733/m.8397 type:complete len:233 (+) Transcript_3733:98-796(+)